MFKNKQEAREILGEIVNLRWKRGKNEMLSPAEELLLDLLMAKNYIAARGKVGQFASLADALGLWPIPEWFRVKRRITPVKEDTHYNRLRDIDWFAAEHLLDGR